MPDAVCRGCELERVELGAERPGTRCPLASPSPQLDRLVEDRRRTWAECGCRLSAGEPAHGQAEDAHTRQDAIAARQLEPSERRGGEDEPRGNNQSRR